MFTETASGARTDRPALAQVLDQLRPGDTPVVWSSTASAAPQLATELQVRPIA